MSGAADGSVSGGPAPPAEVLAAVRLMYVGAALTALRALLLIVDPDRFRDAVAAGQADNDAAQLSANGQLAFYVPFLTISAAVWLAVAWGCRRGRRRARLAAAALGVMYAVFTVVAVFIQFTLTVEYVISLLVAVVAVAVLWLLFRPDSSRYFAAGGVTDR